MYSVEEVADIIRNNSFEKWFDTAIDDSDCKISDVPLDNLLVKKESISQYEELSSESKEILSDHEGDSLLNDLSPDVRDGDKNLVTRKYYDLNQRQI